MIQNFKPIRFMTRARKFADYSEEKRCNTMLEETG